MRSVVLLIFFGLSCRLSAQTFVAGQSYFGANNYIEYVAGNMPLILSAPHGGLLSPASIPDRSCSGCSLVNDYNTQELARAVANAVHERSGCWPHLVINKLHRRKLDANRDITEAADGNPLSEKAWIDFHDFLGHAQNDVSLHFGKGFYVDLHGHAHTIQRLELGYLLYSDELRASDAQLNINYLQYSSIRNLALHNAQQLTHAQLLRGPESLGALLDAHGYPATPSQPDPFPEETEDYFSGGYNTARYGSVDEGRIDGVQIECNRSGVRDSLSQVNRFADSLAVVLLEYLRIHYFGDFTQSFCDYPLLNGQQNPWQVDISPNPYCRSFYVSHSDATADWQAQVFDFYGNFLFSRTIESGVPLQISFAQPKNAFVILRRNGEIMASRTVLQYCK